MILAPVDAGREAGLRSLLASMTQDPGVADPRNDVVPFGRFDRLHFARFVILDDQTLGDITAYGEPRGDFPLYLAFLGDVDGPAASFLAELAEHAGDGLRKIFSHCQGFSPKADLVRWMRDHDQPPATRYVNWVGRTVLQIREEEALRNALEGYVDRNGVGVSGASPRDIRDKLVAFVQGERRAGNLRLSDPEPTPLSWQLSNLFHAIAVPLLLLLLTPFLLLYLPVFIYQLRRRERRDPEIAPRPASAQAKKLAEIEDYSASNQFSAMGSLKPGLFRRCLLTLLLWVIDYTTRHIFNRGRLARVNTIHFARWVFLDNKKRLLFASNYDGSLESYMNDFINKVGWGLNLVFGNGVGYPTTNWLILDGARDEQKFKYYIRRHQLPTEVWYDAHPCLTAVDLERNSRIRQGIDDSSMTDAQILEWLQLI
jgi:hypothetical protein